MIDRIFYIIFLSNDIWGLKKRPASVILKIFLQGLSVGLHILQQFIVDQKSSLHH